MKIKIISTSTLLIGVLGLAPFGAVADVEKTTTTTERTENRALAYPADDSGMVRERSVTQTTVEQPTAYGLKRNAPRVGLMGGIGEVPGSDTAGVVGATLDVQLAKSPLSLGARYSQTGPGEDVTRQVLAGQLAWHFIGDMAIFGYSYIGADVGWTRDKIKPIGFQDDFTSGGPVIGFDQPVSKHMTVGLEGKYLWNLDDMGDTDRQSATGLADIKFWF